MNLNQKDIIIRSHRLSQKNNLIQIVVNPNPKTKLEDQRKLKKVLNCKSKKKKPKILILFTHLQRTAVVAETSKTLCMLLKLHNPPKTAVAVKIHKTCTSVSTTPASSKRLVSTLQL